MSREWRPGFGECRLPLWANASPRPARQADTTSQSARLDRSAVSSPRRRLSRTHQHVLADGIDEEIQKSTDTQRNIAA